MSKYDSTDRPSAPEDPYRKRDFGKSPVVGQSKPYDSGSNVHRKNEKPRTGVSGTKQVPMGGPYKKSPY